MNTLFLKKNGDLYKKALKHFQGQYKDVKELRELHVNNDNQVYSGEWIDKKGIVHFCSGYSIDADIKIKFI